MSAAEEPSTAHGIRRGVALGAALAAVAAALALAAPARGDGPEIGVNVGAAVPLDKYKRTIDGNVGGAFGLEGGYRFDLSDGVALSLLANPQFTFYGTQPGCCAEKNDDEVSSVAALTAGPRLSVGMGGLQTWVGAQGGYYRDMSGPMSDDGAGFNAGGGIGYAVARDTVVGLYGRYDYARMVAAPGSDVDRQWVQGGFGVQHVFAAAPAVVAQAPPPPPPPAPAPTPTRKLVLRGVNFDFDKSNIRADARPVLDEASRTLQEERSVQVAVEGHTDSIGSDAYNHRLSERRANSVTGYLSDHGVERSRLDPSGHGESRPVATNETADGRAQNRRVELRVSAR
jgi:outer membrane protein OmpA-like peptidoglycan-associated protein